VALQGTLKDFPIADIFQLIGQQRKTGFLVLKREDQEVKVFFHKGKIFRAQPSNRSGMDLLGDTLVRAELITEEQLEEGLSIQRKTLQRLGDILVQQGLVDRETVQKVANLQISETIYDLFNWKEGTYNFQAKKLEVATDLAAPIPAENVLMEGIRRLDEWPMVKKKIPDLDMVMERVVDLDLPGEGLSSIKGDKNIGENERIVYKLVDGSNSVREIANMALIGEFETSKALWNLMNAGYVRHAKKGADDDNQEKIVEKLPGMLARSFVGAIFTIIVLIIVGCAAFAVLQAAGMGPVTYKIHHSITPRLKNELIAKIQKDRLIRAIEAYALHMGKYPDKLEDILVEHGMNRSDLSYPWHDDYYYRRLGNGEYILLDPKM